MNAMGPTADGSEFPPLLRRRLWYAMMALATEPRYRVLRWVLAAGLVVRLVLAPLSSWSVDTNGSVLAGISTVYYGNPYLSTTWFNPPLGPFLDVPFMAIPNLIYGPQALFSNVPAIVPVAVRTGVDATPFPIPAALLAWKMPLIVSDAVVALLLFREGPKLLAGVRGELLAAAWFLNPLVIWASSVHGEVDSLAALFVLLFLLTLARGEWAPAGLFLSLAIFSKGFPVVLVPLAVAVVIASPRLAERPLRARLVDLGWWAGGFAVPTLAFLPFIPHTFGDVAAKAVTPAYGGISLLGIFNAASPRGRSGPYFAFTTHLAYAGDILGAFRGAAVVGVLLGLLLLIYLLRKEPVSDRERFRWIALAALAALAGILLADPAPEPENLVGMLPVALLTLPVLSRQRAWAAYAALSAAGITLYWAFLTPFAMMYPLAAALGTPSVDWVNDVAIGYTEIPLLRGTLWLGSGLIGGTVILLWWGSSLVRLIPHRWLAAVRRRGHASVTDPD